MKQSIISKTLLLCLLTTSTAIITLYVPLLIARDKGVGIGDMLWDVYSGLLKGLFMAWCIILGCYITYRILKKIIKRANGETDGKGYYRITMGTIGIILLILLTNTGTAIVTMFITRLLAESQYWTETSGILESLTLIFILLLGCYNILYILKKGRE